MAEIEEKRGRGRPPGTVEDPASLIKTDLGQTLKLQKQLRGVIEEQLEKIKKRLNDEERPVNFKDRLEAIELIAKAMDTLTKSVQQTAGFITKIKESEKKDEMSDEEIIRIIMDGEKG